MTLRIFIDARSPGYAGVRSYASCLLRAIAGLDRGHQYVLLRAPRDPEWGLPGFEERVLPSNNYLRWMSWSNTRLPRLLERERFDVYHSLKHITLLRGRTKKLVTFHSARFLIHPEHYKWHDATYWRVMSPIAARKYDAVIAVSSAEKENYVGRMGAPADKLHVIPLAADSRFRIIDDRKSLDAARAKYRLPERFLLFVGRLLPVKNLETLLRAYRLARERGVEHGLVIVGRPSWHSPKLEALARELGLEEHARFLGPVFEELPEVYNLADLFLLVSHYEAFPAVPLEAMACGTPVVASDRGGLPEVVGDAGRIVPATDAEAMAGEIVTLLESTELRTALRERGIERSRSFTWERCARGTVDLYERISKEP